MEAARVVLKNARTYKVHGKTWLKDVPKIVKKEDEIKSYESNGYFHVRRFQDQTPKETPRKKTSSGKKFVRRSLN